MLGRRLREHVTDLPEQDRRPARVALTALADERSSARADLLDALAGERYLDLLETLVAASRSPALQDAATTAGAAALRPLVAKRWRDVERAVRAAVGKDDAALHRVRIAAKRARYAAEAAISVLGPRAGAVAKALAGVQEVLGEVQDAVVAERWLREVVHPTGRADVATALAIGQLVSRERAAATRARDAWPRASKRAVRAWRDFGS